MGRGRRHFLVLMIMRIPALALALLMPITTFAASATTKIMRTFPDVQTSHPNYEAIMYLAVNEVVQGNPSGMFNPDSSINRAEFTKIIVETIADQNVIETCPTGSAGGLFNDIGGDEWFARYICVAKTYGLAQGNPDGSYRPNNPINFAEASKMLTTNLDLYRGGPGTGSTIWFKPYILAMAEARAIPVSITNFDQFITRGEMAEMLYRIEADIPPKPSLTYEQLETLTRSGAASSRSLFFIVPSVSSVSSATSVGSVTSVMSSGASSSASDAMSSSSN